MTHRPLAPEGRAAAAAHRLHQPCPVKARPYVLAATIIASAMAFIDSTVVGIAVPAIQKEPGGRYRRHAVGGECLPADAGRPDPRRRRPRRPHRPAAGLPHRHRRRSRVASLACALAPTVETLIAARAIQGIGAALLVPQSLAIIAANFPKDIRGQAIGTWAAASAVTTALGPPIGGFLIDLLSWRAAFWINLPLAVVALWLTLALHAGEPRRGRDRAASTGAARSSRCSRFGALTYGLSAISEGQRQPEPFSRCDRSRADRHCDLCRRRNARGQSDHAAGDVPLEGIHQRQHRDRVPLRRAERRALPRCPSTCLPGAA